MRFSYWASTGQTWQELLAGAKHAEATGLRYRRDHVAAVAEREDRKLQIQHLGVVVLHDYFPLLRWASAQVSIDIATLQVS